MRTPIRHQYGLSLISLMVALLIGTFLLAGLFTVWFQTRTTFKIQNLTAQVQDNQRMALIILGNAVQSAGYYPVAANYGSSAPSPLRTQANVFTATGNFTAIGQAIWGSHPASGSDTLQVRFMADTTTGYTLDCLGQTETAGTMVTETFSVDSNNNLACAPNGLSTPSALVPNVQNFTVLYGVSTSHDNSVQQYLTADKVTAGTLWAYVQSVNLQLTFSNPLNGVAGAPGQSTTLPVVTRVVSLTQNAK